MPLCGPFPRGVSWSCGANRMWQKWLHVAFEARSWIVLQISPWSPWSLGRSIHHVVGTLQQPQGGVHRERNWGSQLPAGTNLVQCMSHSESESSYQAVYIMFRFLYTNYTSVELNIKERESSSPSQACKWLQSQLTSDLNKKPWARITQPNCSQILCVSIINDL